MLSFQAEAEGRILAVNLAEQPDATIARFEFEKHLASLLQDNPVWPESTKNVSEIRLSFRVQRQGLKSIFGETTTIHLDIVDYPGEWLLDLGLMDKSYETWSQNILTTFTKDEGIAEKAYLKKARDFDGNAKHSETVLAELTKDFRELILQRHASGKTDTVPGRFLLPGELEGAPAITFAPLPKTNGNKRSAYGVFESRFESYKKKVIAPFFKTHFSKIDRQIVLIDVLGALEKGKDALSTLEKAMTDILSAFRPGKNGLVELFLGRKIEKIAFVATKADLLHHFHHEKIVDLTRALVKSAERRALYSDAQTSAKALASLRSTIEDKAKHDGKELAIVRGKRASDGKSVGFHFGDLPLDSEAYLLGSDIGKFEAPKLLPPDLTSRSKSGLPHVRMDQLVEFLIGDRLR